MSVENGVGYSPESQKLDEQWFQRFSEIGAFEAYTYFEVPKTDLEEERKLFESGEHENPTFSYPKLHLDDLRAKEDGLLALKQEILLNETNDLVRQTYRWKINEKIAELRMMKAAAEGDMRRFNRYSAFVHGEPSKDIFAYTISRLREGVSEGLASDDADIAEAAGELDGLLPTLQEAPSFSLPDAHMVQTAKERTLEEVHDLVALPEGIETFDDEGIRQIFEGAISKVQAEGWQVVLDPNAKSIHVNQEEKTVSVPEHRQETAQKLQQLIAHEIATHVGRRARGERSRLMLLGLGLDRYLKGEEGVTTMREQALGRSVQDFAGFDGHFAISLAKGLDGRPRDFHSVCDLLKKVYTFQRLRAGKPKVEAEQMASKSAWDRAFRTFRGTDGKTPGVCYTKDIVYREGNIDVWNVVRNNPQELARLSVGKYDPANPRHLWILEQLGITDGDLETVGG